MKRILPLLFFLTTSLGLAQVGVNTTTPDPSSMLDISATNKGVLVPRVSLSNVTLTTLDGTNTAATGLLIWNTNAATTGGNGVGFYYFNGTQWIPITQSGAADHDWYEVGTTTAPNAITDDMFHTGNVVVGKNTIGFDNPKLSVEESGSGTPSPLKIVNIKDASTSTSAHNGMYLEMTATTSANEYGITVEHTNPNAPLKYGVHSSVNNGSGTNSSFQGRVSGTGLNLGTSILISDSGSPSNGIQGGFEALFQQPTTSFTRGLYNQFGTNNLALDGGPKYGVYNSFGGPGRNVGGELYGSYNAFDANLTSFYNKYGSFTLIPSTVGGIHYGIYAEVPKSNSYAGYFLGRVSVGTTIANNYIFPSSRGANGQTMQTDGSGNVTWVNPVVDTDDQTTDVFSLTGSTLNLSLQNDGVATQTVDLSPLKDHDFYEVGGTTAPDSITDNKYTQGTLTIGTNTAATGVLDVDNATKATSVDVTNTYVLNPVGIDVSLTSLNSTKTGVKTTFNGASPTGNNTFISNIDNTTGNSNRTGILQEFNGTSSSIATTIRGVKNDFKSTASYYAVIHGIENSFADNNNSFKYGLTNNFLNGGSSQSTGVLNNFNGTSTGIAYGVYNASNNYNGLLYGMQNIFSGTGNNDHFGMFNYFDGTGTGNKYGIYNNFPTTAGGTHYGIYSDVLKSGSYAGYFLGNVSIGTTVLNNYILPASRGTNGQTMQTDGSGNVSWVTPTTSTDADWFQLNTTNPASTITDNIYTQGKVSVGSSTSSNGKFNVYNASETYSLYAENTSSPAATTYTGYFSNNGTGANQRYGLYTDVNGAGSGNRFGIFNNNNSTTTGNQGGMLNFLTGTNADFVYGLRNIISATGSSGQFQYGMYNDLSTISDSQITGVYNFNTSNGNGTHYGTHNRILGNGNGFKYGVYNHIAGNGIGLRYGVYNYLTGSGTNAKYGTYNLMDPAAGGTHYGLYSEALKTGSFAGYFLGNVSVGTTTANNYILPASRGTNGQIMQTDGSGNVSWVNPVVDTDTDDQGTDVFSLTGNTLNLSLQNDGVATQTVDLSSLKDADWYEVGGTSPADAITDNIYTSGDVSVGKVTAATGKFDVSNNTKLNTLVIDNTTAAAGLKSGINNSITIQSGNNASSAILNTISGTALSKYGVSNSFANANPSGLLFEYGNSNYFASTGNTSEFGSINYFSPTATNSGQAVGLRNEIMGNNNSGTFVGVENEVNNNTNNFQIGIDNLFNGGGTGGRYGTNNNFFGNSNGEVIGTQTNIQTTGTGSKFGEKIIINSASGGVHFGLYADVTKTGSYAGYFLGNVSIGTSIGNEYILPASRGTNGQIMQTDGSGNVTWVNNAAVDADWFEVGGLTPANSILDNIFTGGDVSIGKATAATGKVDIEADNKAMTLVLDNNNATTGLKSGIENNITLNTNNIYSAAITNNVNGNSGFKFGVTNHFNVNNTGPVITELGYNTDFSSTGNVNFIGNHNFVIPFTNNTGSIIGYQNTISNAAIGSFIGLLNNHSVTSNTLKTGIQNSFTGGGTGDYNGLTNNFTGNANGEFIGINTIINSAGTGLKYGEKIFIDNTSGGIHCGIYADVTKANSYAGYFLGRVSIGNTLANNYILPSSRGTNGQIMQTDGAGNVSWVNPTTFTDTDDQQIDVLSLTGDTLNISLQDDAVATQTLNLGAIDNQATDVFSLTGNTLNLSLQNDGVATQTVDLSSLTNDWKLTGNAGTLSGTNFIGTTDAQDMDFRVNNIVKIRLTQQGQLSFVNAGGSVFVGINAGDADDLTSNQNTFVGSTSGQLTSTGNLNTAIGHASLNQNVSGIGNSGLGKSSLLTNTTGSNNTGLGRLADVATFGLSNATAVGYNATVSVSDKVRLGSATVTVVEGQVPYTNPSDARFKFNVKENVPGLDFIKKLKPVTYNFDTKKFDEHLNRNRNKSEVAEEDFSKSTAIVRTGFLAQDVEKICNDLGYNFDGLHIPDANNPTDNYGIAYSQFIMPIVKAVQEQQVIIENQKTELEQLKSELEKYKQLEERIKALEQK